MYVVVAVAPLVVHRISIFYEPTNRGSRLGTSIFLLRIHKGYDTLLDMKLLVIYRPNSEFARPVEDFIHDFQRHHEGVGRRMEVLSTESREGAAMMSLYDIMQHPAIMVLTDDGRMVQFWSGPTLPLLDEVAGYFYTSGS